MYIIFPMYPIYCFTTSYYFGLFRIVSFFFALLRLLFRTISAKFGTTEVPPRNTYNVGTLDVVSRVGFIEAEL